jgi:cyanate permease
MSRSVVTAGTFLGPIIAGFFYDVTKSYTIAFGVFAVVSLAATLFMFFAKPPQRVCGN